MAGAIRREGWDLIARVDYSQIKTANQLTDEWRANLETTEKLLKGLKVPDSVVKKMSAVKANTEEVTKQADKLNKRLKETGSAGADSAEKVNSKMQATSSSTDKATKSTDELAKSYKRAAQAASTAARQSGTAAQQSAENLEKRYGSLGNKLKATMGVVTAGIGVGLVAAVKKGADSAAGLQQSYTTIKNLAVTGGESVAEATKNVMAMQREGQAMSIKYGKSQQDIAEGYEDLVKRGYTTGQALSALTSEVQASIASGDSLSDTYSVTSKVLEGFAMRSSNSSVMLANTKKVVNELAYTADLTSTGFSDLGYGMSYTSSVAKQANISLSQTAAALGILSNNGLESTRAGTGLRTVILRLQSDIAKFGKTKNGKSLSVLQGLGIDKDQITQSDGSLRSLSQIMGVLQAAVEKTYPKDKTMQANVFKSLFGTEGVNAAEILAQNAREVDSLAKKVKQAGDEGNYVQQLAAKNSGTAKVQAKSAREALEAFEMTLGNAVLPSINKASQELAKFLTSKDGKTFQKDVADVVAKFANGLVSFIEWLPRHEGEVKGFALTLAGLWGTTKIVGWIKWIGTAKSAVIDLKNVIAGLNDGSLFTGLTGGAQSASQAASGVAKGATEAAASTGAEAATATGALGKVTGVLGKAAPWVGVGISALDVGTSITRAIKSGSKSQEVAAASKTAGATIGGLIGFAVGGPMGASVGAGIGDTVGSSKFAQNVTNDILSGKGGVQYRNGTVATNISKPKKSVKEKQAESVGTSLKKATEAKLKFKVAIDSKSLKSSAKEIIDAYKNVFKISQQNSKKKQSSETDTLTAMYKAGVISKKRYEQLLSQVKSKEENFRATNKQNYESLVKDTKQETSERAAAYNKYYRGIAKISQKGAKSRKQLEKELNSSLSKIDEKYSSDERSRTDNMQKYMVKSWANKNTKELHQLETSIKRKKKLTKAEARDLVSQTESTTRKVIDNAEKRKSATISAARKQYEKSKGQYWKLYHDEGVISKSEYEAAKDSAWKKYKETKNAAKDTASAVESKAKEQRDSVKKYAEKEAGDYRTAWQKTKDWFSGLWTWFSKKWSGLWSWLRKLNDVKPNYSFIGVQDAKLDTGKYKTAKTKHYKNVTGGYALEQRASGGYVAASRVALVGEAGPELAYRVGGSKARILGANGPEMAKIQAGERILNAKDTAKAMSGGIGKGTVLSGYANGTAKLTGPGSNASKMVSDSKKLGAELEKATVGSYKATRVNSAKQLKAFQKDNQSTWSTIYRSTSKQTNKTYDNSVKDYSDMRKGVLKQMDNLQDGVTGSAKTTAKNFGNALGKMHTYARKAMSNTVDQLNSGIKSIDKVLSQFGGNSSVINPVHFATGTRNGKLAQDTLAVVNDAKTGPRQEAIVRSGQVYLPRGNDTLIPLKKGDEVLNGAQTQELAHSWGLPHFAKGSGVDKKRLRSIASKGAANPGKSFNQNFEQPIKSTGAKIQQGTTDLAKASTKDYGTKWMKAMWDVIESKISSGSGKGGTREAFERYAEAHYMGKPYNMGSMGPTYYDCSGMVASALQHFGINIGRTTVAMQNSSGVTNLGKDISKTTRGDLVIFGHGTGAKGHVGIVNNSSTGTMFNETPPSARLSDISDDTSMGYSFYRIKGLHDGSSKSKKADSRLEALAKRQLGSKALRWISKNLSESVDFGGSLNLTGDQSSRIQSLSKALKSADPSATKNGIAAIVGNWLFESGLNSGIVNSIGASGLGQWLGGRLSNLKAYAKKTGRSWSNAGTQIGFALKADGSDSSIFKSILEGKGSVASLANRFSSEWERGGYDANHVAGAETVANTLGYASGGHPAVGNTVKVGEHGPELAEFKQPVHIYSAEDTKKKEAGLTKLSKIGKSKSISSKPTINININGNISSESDALKYAKLIKQELANVFSNIGDEFGLDPSFY